MPDSLPNPNLSDDIPDLEEKELLVWRAPERTHKQRGKEFYSTIIILALLVSIILFFIEGLMPVLVIWAIVFVVWAISKTPPAEIEHKLTTWGIRTANTLYRYNQIGQAWFEDKDGQRLLRTTLSIFPWQLNFIVPTDQERAIKQTLTQMDVPFLRPDPTRVDKMIKWFNEKIPLEETK